MPEGDTLLRAARLLAPALEGKALLALRAPLGALGASLVGRRIERVEARGKNLLLHLEGGRALHTHLGMAGSWRLVRPGEPWPRPAHLARVVVEVDDAIAICFLAAHVELIASQPRDGGPPLGHLGPDLLRDDFDVAEARSRLRAIPERPLGEALMDQRAVAGVGNVYTYVSEGVVGIVTKVGDTKFFSAKNYITKTRKRHPTKNC